MIELAATIIVGLYFVVVGWFLFAMVLGFFFWLTAPPRPKPSGPSDLYTSFDAADPCDPDTYFKS